MKDLMSDSRKAASIKRTIWETFSLTGTVLGSLRDSVKGNMKKSGQENIKYCGQGQTVYKTAIERKMQPERKTNRKAQKHKTKNQKQWHRHMERDK